MLFNSTIRYDSTKYENLMTRNRYMGVIVVVEKKSKPISPIFWIDPRFISGKHTLILKRTRRTLQFNEQTLLCSTLRNTYQLGEFILHSAFLWFNNGVLPYCYTHAHTNKLLKSTMEWGSSSIKKKTLYKII